jgi:hypothetical protein
MIARCKHAFRKGDGRVLLAPLSKVRICNLTVCLNVCGIDSARLDRRRQRKLRLIQVEVCRSEHAASIGRACGSGVLNTMSPIICRS